MRTINIHEAKTHLSRILQDVERGETYLICRNGHAVADLVAHERSRRTAPDPHLSRIIIDYDPTEDMSADEWGEID